MKIFKKNKQENNKELVIRWRWIGEDEVQEERGNSAGLTSLLADWCVEVLEVHKVGER